MANDEHCAILRQGVEAWNRWRYQNPGLRPDLSGLQLENSILPSIDLPSTLGIVVQNKATEGVPSIGFNNFSIGVNPYFGGNYNNMYQIMDNLCSEASVWAQSHAGTCRGASSADCTRPAFGILASIIINRSALIDLRLRVGRVNKQASQSASARKPSYFSSNSPDDIRHVQ